MPGQQRESPFVGRERESGLLRAWWASVRDGGGRLLLVDGDPGIGKTRLVVELARAVEEDGALVLWGRCDEDHVAPFQPVAEALGRYFQTLSADWISRMPDWQLTELSRLVVRLREYAPSLEEEGGDPESGRFRFFEAVTATLNELSADGTILLVVDNLHWADQPTLLLLRHILRSTEDGKLGVIGMYTDTEVPPDHPVRSMLADCRAAHPVETVHLRGLSPTAVEALARNWPKAPSDLVPQLCRLTDGNPLFLDELLRQFGDRGDEPGDESHTPVPTDLSPTEAIRELVARRVSRLPEDVIYLLQAAAVAGPECEAGIVAEAAELAPDRRLDAFDLVEESRLLRRIGDGFRDRYAFNHALVRDAIYRELLRGQRVRYHHKIAVATERAHADELDNYVNELAYHFYSGAALADGDKAARYCLAAGEHALQLLSFEEAQGYLTRSLAVAEEFVPHDQTARCDALMALAEAQNRADDTAQADANFKKAASLARAMGDAGRLATVALRAVPMSFHGIAAANEEHVQLLEEARATLTEEDSHLRAMVTARLGLVILIAPGPGLQERSLTLNAEAVAMARRLGDRNALGYALSARMHALWGIASAPERLATGTELGEIADDIGDELLALHGHMWRVRGLLAQGDVDAVNEERARFRARDSGPVHPREASFSHNVAAMMALVAGDFDTAESSSRQALEVAEGYNDQALTFYGGLMMWTWWQRDDFASPAGTFRKVITQAPVAYPTVRAALALHHAEAGATGEALASLRSLSDLGWINAADDRTEGVSLALAAAACSVVGDGSRDLALHVYQEMRPYAGTVIVARAPAAACLGPADQYLGLLAAVMGDLALDRGASGGLAATRPPDGLRTLRRGGRGRAGPNAAPARPGGRRGAGGRAPAQRGGVGLASGFVALGAHGRRAGVTPVSRWRCRPRSRARPVRLRAGRPHRAAGRPCS